MNKEEEKTVISMDMGGAIEPVELPKEEETGNVIELPPAKEVELPQLMQIGPQEDTPPIMENPTEAKVETPPAKPKPRPIPTIGPIPITPPKPVEEKVEEKKEEKPEAPAAPETPKPEVPAAPTTPTPEVPKAPTLEEIKEEAKKEALAGVKPAPAPTVPLVPTPPQITEAKEEVKTVTLPTVEAPTIPETPKVEEEKTEEKVDELDKTVAIPTEEIKEEIKEEKAEEEVKEKEPEGPAVIKGPNVIDAPVATTDKEKEKKKNPYFLECPPNCIPIKPMGYIGYNILYAIPVIGLIFMLAHSASSKNYNRRNHARSKLIAIFLIVLLLAGIIYFFKIDVLSIIENATGYKIDIQHFKFTKFK